MKKQKRHMTVLLLILAVIAGAYIAIRLYNARYPAENEGTESCPVTQTDSSSVTGLALTGENGTLTFEKKEEKWHCLEDESADIDTVSMEALVSAAVSVTGEDRITSVKDMAQYGLEKPELTVTFTAADGTVTLKIGDYNSSVSRYYICLEGEDTVYTIDSSTKNSLTKTLEDLKTVAAEETAEE